MATVGNGSEKDCNGESSLCGGSFVVVGGEEEGEEMCNALETTSSHHDVYPDVLSHGAGVVEGVVGGDGTLYDDTLLPEHVEENPPYYVEAAGAGNEDYEDGGKEQQLGNNANEEVTQMYGEDEGVVCIEKAPSLKGSVLNEGEQEQPLEQCDVYVGDQLAGEEGGEYGGEQPVGEEGGVYDEGEIMEGGCVYKVTHDLEGGEAVYCEDQALNERGDVSDEGQVLVSGEDRGKELVYESGERGEEHVFDSGDSGKGQVFQSDDNGEEHDIDSVDRGELQNFELVVKGEQQDYDNGDGGEGEGFQSGEGDERHYHEGVNEEEEEQDAGVGEGEHPLEMQCEEYPHDRAGRVHHVLRRQLIRNDGVEEELEGEGDQYEEECAQDTGDNTALHGEEECDKVYDYIQMIHGGGGGGGGDEHLGRGGMSHHDLHVEVMDCAANETATDGHPSLVASSLEASEDALKQSVGTSYLVALPSSSSTMTKYILVPSSVAPSGVSGQQQGSAGSVLGSLQGIVGAGQQHVMIGGQRYVINGNQQLVVENSQQNVQQLIVSECGAGQQATQQLIVGGSVGQQATQLIGMQQMEQIQQLVLAGRQQQQQIMMMAVSSQDTTANTQTYQVVDNVARVVTAGGGGGGTNLSQYRTIESTLIAGPSSSTIQQDSSNDAYNVHRIMTDGSLCHKCLVCGDKSSGVHYGVLACEGCKGFFRRALQDVGDPSQRKCYYNKNCDVNIVTRNRCRYCRLKKCLSLGMSRTAAKLGRRSHKMKELISEASRTIEDSQTAQALHGLLSLKSPNTTSPNDLPTLLRAIGQQKETPSTITSRSSMIQIISSPLSTEEALNAARVAVGLSPTPTPRPSSVQLSGGNRNISAAASDASASPTVQYVVQIAPQTMAFTPTTTKTRTVLPKPTTVRQTKSVIDIVTTTSSVKQPIILTRAISTPASTALVSRGYSSITPSLVLQSSPVSTAPTHPPPTPQNTVPIHLIATSQGMIAIPQNYQVQAPAAATAKMIVASNSGAGGNSTQAPVVFYTVPQGSDTPQFVTFPSSSSTSSSLLSQSLNISSSVGAVGTLRNIVGKQKRKLSDEARTTANEPLAKIERISSVTTGGEGAETDRKPIPCDSRTLESIIRAATAGGGNTMILDSAGNRVSLSSLLNLLPKSTTAAAVQSDVGVKGGTQGDAVGKGVAQQGDGVRLFSPVASVSHGSNPNAQTSSGAYHSDLAAQIQDGYEKSFFNPFTQSSGLTRKLLANDADMGDEQLEGSVVDGSNFSIQCWQHFKTRLCNIVQDVISFAKKIPGFSSFELLDQIALLKGGGFEPDLHLNVVQKRILKYGLLINALPSVVRVWAEGSPRDICEEVACTVFAAQIDAASSTINLSDFGRVSCDDLKAAFPLAGKFIDLLFNFSSRFNAFKLTPTENALFCSIMLIAPDRHVLKDTALVEKLQDTLIDSLRRTVEEEHVGDTGLFSRTLLIISNLRDLSVEYRRMITGEQAKAELNDELQREILEILGIV